MSEFVTTLTQRSQVTVPVEVRRVLGLKPRDQVMFEIEGNEVRMKPVEWTVESVAGSVKPLKDGPYDLEQMIHEAKEDYYEEKMRREYMR